MRGLRLAGLSVLHRLVGCARRDGQGKGHQELRGLLPCSGRRGRVVRVRRERGDLIGAPVPGWLGRGGLMLGSVTDQPNEKGSTPMKSSVTPLAALLAVLGLEDLIMAPDDTTAVGGWSPVSGLPVGAPS